MSNTARQPGTSADDTQAPQGCVVYVTPDCTDSAVRKRAHGFLSAGMDLISFSFRRTRYNVDFLPDWPNIELGITTERRLLTRVFVSLRALWAIYGHRRAWRTAFLVYARNLDVALLALIGKAVTRCPAPFVYEVLDIHPATTKRGFRGVLLRWLERRVLARSQLLVVSSPAFLRNYFHPTQRYHGESFLLENKWPSAEMSALTRKNPYELTEHEPRWTIGWFGNIRCPQSLEILTELADTLPDRVRIYIRGCASLLGEQQLMDVIRHRENMVFEGEYCAPSELAAIYSKIHFNWCGDLCGGENSLWLLPNRLYEGGYFGIPALAIGSHETGRVVRQRQLGISLETPVAEHLRDVLSKTTRQEYVRLRRRIESLPEENFVDNGGLAQLMRTVSQQHGSNEDSQPVSEFQHDGVGQNR
jgi:succinoglycan biosynthesis protein ExoL